MVFTYKSFCNLLKTQNEGIIAKLSIIINANPTNVVTRQTDITAEYKDRL